MQLASPSYQRAPSTSIFALNGFVAQVLRARPDVGEATEPILQAAVGVADHARVEARAGHHREALAVEAADVERRARPASPISTASSMSFGMPRFVARRLAVPAGMIASVARVPASDVDASLHHPVAAPHEDQLGPWLRAPSRPASGA